MISRWRLALGVWGVWITVGGCGGGSGGGEVVAPPATPPAAPPPTTTPPLDTTGFLEIAAGTAPLVIVAPHGGALKPASIPDRTCAGCEVLADANTMDLARAIVEAFERRTGKRPFLALNHLHRVKFDGNRDLDEATGSHTMLNGVWNSWQGALDSATVRAARIGGRALYVEVHGHAHEVPRIELGYLLTSTQLRMSDSALAVASVLRQSSIARLVTDARSGASDVALLRGTASFGALLANAGYPAVPSPADPAPKTGEGYFTGGYNTVRHGSRDGGAADAIQMECYFAGLRDTADNRAAFADKVAAALAEFLLQQYGWRAP
jgi:hypothetical protein